MKRKGWPLVLDDKTIVRGAGGIVYRFRTESKEHPEILLIHRPRLNDWSFPKGRLDPGETSEACALREVLEETGYVCTLDDPDGVGKLPTVRYMDPSGRPKEVRFWKMLPAFPLSAGQAGGASPFIPTPSGSVGSKFVPNDEVDKIEWMDARDAFTRLTHKTDRLLLKRFLHGY